MPGYSGLKLAKKNIMATLVKFYLENDGSNDVFAYFPQIKADTAGNRMSYSHIGQHSACSKEYINECTEANIFQYKTLLRELEISVGYDCRVLNKEPKNYIASFNYFEISLPGDVVRLCSGSGDATEDVTRCMELPEVAAELAKLDPEKLKKELCDYGAWDDEQLADHKENLMRILWIAAGDIYEGR